MDNSIKCLLDPGVGTGFSILIGNVWTSLPSQAGYSLPAVSSAVASATDELSVSGNVIVTAHGRWLGALPCAANNVAAFVVVVQSWNVSSMTFDAHTSTFAGSVQQSHSCFIQSWNDSVVVCRAAVGETIPMAVDVTVAGTTVSRPIAHSNLVPSVTRVMGDGELSTVGGDVVAVQGSGFGPGFMPLAVTVGGSLVTCLSHNDSVAWIVVPRGGGSGIAVRIFTIFGSTAPQPLLSYAALHVGEVIAPSGEKSCAGGFQLQITGEVSCVNVWFATHAVRVDHSLVPSLVAEFCGCGRRDCWGLSMCGNQRECQPHNDIVHGTSGIRDCHGDRERHRLHCNRVVRV